MLFQYVTLSPPTDEALNYIVFFQSNLQKWLCDIKSPEVAKNCILQIIRLMEAYLMSFYLQVTFCFKSCAKGMLVFGSNVC